MTREEFLEDLRVANESIDGWNRAKERLLIRYSLESRRYCIGDRVSVGDDRVFEITDIKGYDEGSDSVVYQTYLVSKDGEVSKRGKAILEKDIMVKN